MNSFTYSASLAEALCGLLDNTPRLHEHVLHHVTALACPYNLPEFNTDAGATPPLWCQPAGSRPHLDARQSSCQALKMDALHLLSCAEENKTRESIVFGPIQLVLILDTFEVAQTSPVTCSALLNTPCTTVDASAAAAVCEWLRRYALQYQKSEEQCESGGCAGVRNNDRAVERHTFAQGFPLSWPPWPPVWWAALEAKSVACNVRVLLLRVPSIYAVFTSEDGTAGRDCLLKPLFSSRALLHSTQPMRKCWGATMESGTLAGLSAVSAGSAGEEMLSGVSGSRYSFSHRRLSGISAALSARSAASSVTAWGLYPSDSFLEVTPVVYVVGVVDQVCYENRRATSPAPWVTLLLLLPFSAVPVRRQVDLSAVGPHTVNVVAVIGEVVGICGYTKVASRQTAGKRCVSRGTGETLLQEYIVASWAVLLLHPSSLNPCSLSPGVSEQLQKPFARTPLSSASPPATAIPLASATYDPFVQKPPLLQNSSSPRSRSGRENFFFCLPNRADGYSNGDLLVLEAASVVELSAWEEERAVRVALTCWEGTRLALGVEAADAENGNGGGGNTYATTAFFTTLDVVIAVQLSLLSAQLSDGVVLLLVDETPESLVTQMLVSLDQIAPTATLELPSTTLCRAQPSFFLPSYRVQNIPVSVQLSRRPTTPTVTATAAAAAAMGDADAMRPPTSRAPLGKTCTSGSAAWAATAAVPALPPPFFAEVLRGGALTHASGRTLVLQGIEAIPTATLKVLQEALRSASNDDEDLKSTAAVTPATLGSGTGVNTPEVSLRSFPKKQQNSPFSQMLNNSNIMDTNGKPNAHRSVDGARHAIQREGGQFVRYRVTHAAVCTIRQGIRLVEKSHLFEFAQRCDVVVRPSFDRQRQAAALQASAEAQFQHLLCRRCEVWRSFLGNTLALPSHLSDDGGNTNGGREKNNAAVTAPPTLTEACNRLLSTYFIAAKALCVEGADASMMSTLVKLTVTHAQWRQRFMKYSQRGGGGGTRRTWSTAASLSLPSPRETDSSIVASQGTALIDAVVAVSLCDATLHFFTAKTLLGECVLRLLEREAWPIWEAEEAAAAHRVREHHDMEQDSYNNENHDSCWCPSYGCGPEASTEVQQLYRQVELRTRFGDGVFANFRAPLPASASTFSIRQLVQDLMDHLERVAHNAASTPGENRRE